MYKFTTTADLARDMGPGWETAPDYSIKKGRARLYYEHCDSYLCTVHVGDIITAIHGKTPFEALVNCLEDVRAKRDSAEEILNLLTDNRHYGLVRLSEAAASQAEFEKVLGNW